jgi:hypothetical protein
MDIGKTLCGFYNTHRPFFQSMARKEGAFLRSNYVYSHLSLENLKSSLKSISISSLASHTGLFQFL